MGTLSYKRYLSQTGDIENSVSFSRWLNYAYPERGAVRKIHQQPFEEWLNEYWPMWKNNVNSSRYIDLRAAFEAGQGRCT